MKPEIVVHLADSVILDLFAVVETTALFCCWIKTPSSFYFPSVEMECCRHGVI